MFAGISGKPPLNLPSGLFAAVAAISTTVTATAHGTELRTGTMAASVPSATAGISSATPFS